MENSNTDIFLRLNPNFQELEGIINSELKNKYLLKEKIESYNSRSKGIKYELVENEANIKIKIRAQDVKDKISLYTQDLQNKIYFFNNDCEKRFKIIDVNLIGNFYLFTLELHFEPKIIPEQGNICYNQYSGDDYQNYIILKALNDLKSLKDKNSRNLVVELIINSVKNSNNPTLNSNLLEAQINSFTSLFSFPPSLKQKEVLKNYLQGQNLIFIKGDAGTGKSTVLHFIIKNEIDNGKRVLCVAHSNKIVDEYLNNLLKLKLGNRLFLRLSRNRRKIQDNLQGYSFEAKYENSYKETIRQLNKKILNNKESKNIIKIQNKWKKYLEDNSRIYRRLSIYSSEAIFSTTMGLFNYINLFSKQIPFDTIIFDEGSLITFSEFISFGQFGKRWIVAGDDNQLKQFRKFNVLNLLREEIFNIRLEKSYLFHRKDLHFNSIGFYESRLKKHLKDIKIENFIGWNIIKTIESKNIFAHLKNKDHLIELEENFRLPRIIDDIFKKALDFDVNLDRHGNLKIINSSLEDQLKNIIVFKKTDKFKVEAMQSGRGRRNQKEADLTLMEIKNILHKFRNETGDITIGVGAAWNDQINLISKLIRGETSLFIQIDEKGRIFQYKNKNNIIILLDTFWSLASKNIDILIWNFVKSNFIIRGNFLKIKGGIFNDLYADNPNLFNCFLKRFKKKLIIIGNSESFRRYIGELSEYIEIIQENRFSNQALNKKNEDFKRIRNVLAIILNYSNISDFYPK